MGNGKIPALSRWQMQQLRFALVKGKVIDWVQ